MADFALVHGACHRAGIWRGVMAALGRLGHNAVAVSLLGDSMGHHAQEIIAASAPGAILVGHSAGGFAAHAAVLAAPRHFAGLVYLCAFIPQPGQTVADLRRAAPVDHLGPAIRRHGLHYDFDPMAAPSLFFHDCPSPAAHAATLRRDPIAPMRTALAPLPGDFPRAAIICDDDRAISPGYQAQMAHGIARQLHLPCGHAPFFAMPDLLAQRLHDLATKFGRL